MLKKISTYTKILTIFFIFCFAGNSTELSIIPLKKPFLEDHVKKSKIYKNIIKPQKKPLENDKKEMTA